MTKKTILTVAAVSVLSGGLVVATTAFAQTSTSGHPSLVQEIANKFHLNTSDVQSVFDQHRQVAQSKREANYETYLNNLVKDGKITDAQKQLILNKHNDLISQKTNFKNMTLAERRAQMQASRQDLQNWAKQNNINLQYLRPFGPGMRKFGGFGKHNQVTPTP